MDLGSKILVGVLVGGVLVAFWQIIAWAARRASRRRRAAAGHGLGDEQGRHRYAAQRADEELLRRPLPWQQSQDEPMPMKDPR